MFSITLKRSFVALAVGGGLLAVAGPASAGAAAPTNGNTSRIGTGDGADVIDGLISNGSADDQMVNAPFGLNITGPRH
jgi:hypothetical protein